MWTINGKLIGRTHVEVQVHCLCYTAAPEGVYVNVLVGGLANGNVRLVQSISVHVVLGINSQLNNYCDWMQPLSHTCKILHEVLIHMIVQCYRLCFSGFTVVNRFAGYGVRGIYPPLEIFPVRWRILLFLS